MFGSRWVITPLWLSGSWRSFLYSSSVYSCHLFLISPTSVRSIPCLSFIESIFAWNVTLVSLIFLRSRSLSHSIVFLYFFALITEEGFLISLLVTLWNSAFKWVYLSFSPLLLASFLFSAICKPSSSSRFAFLHLFFLGMVLLPVSCAMSRTSVHSSSGTLSIGFSPLSYRETPRIDLCLIKVFSYQTMSRILVDSEFLTH